MAEENKPSKPKIVSLLFFGAIFAVIHILTSQVVMRVTAPQELVKLEKNLVQLEVLRKKLNLADFQITDAQKEESPQLAEVAKTYTQGLAQIQALSLDNLLRKHLVTHYGKDPFKKALKEVKLKAKQVTLANHEQWKKIDTHEIASLYNFLAEQQQNVTKNNHAKVSEDIAKFSQMMKAKSLDYCVPASKRNYLHTLFAFILGFLTFFFMKRSQQIYSKILVGMLAGAIFGYLYGPYVSSYIEPMGDIFIRMIKMVVVPLVFASLALGVISLGDISKVGRIGGKTIGYYLLTTACAITIGLVLANVIQPGQYIDPEQKESFQEEYQESVKGKLAGKEPQSISTMIVNIVPTNPIKAMANGDMLQVIFFALFFGLVLATIDLEKKRSIEMVLDGINDAMIKMVVWVMEIAPYGVFALMAKTVAQAGVSVLAALAVYALVVLAGLFLHVVLIYGSAIRMFAKIPLGEFFSKFRSVQLLAFSTSSSAATLPVTMKCAQEQFGVKKEVSSFVLPLGATINMDGTALYQGVAAMFIAQVFLPVPLDLGQQLTIIFTATLASIGTAAVPGAGIVILAMVLEAVGIPTIGIALIMGVDRILDMCRTTVNVTGDRSATLFVASTENDA